MTPFQKLAKALAALNAEQRVALAKEHNIDPRLAHRAAKAAGRVTVRPFPAWAFVELCAALNVDPVGGWKGDKRFASAGSFNKPAFAIAIRLARIDGDLSVRAAATKFKVATVTLSRAENHADISVEPFLAICKGLKRHPFDFLVGPTFHGQHKVEQVDKAGVSA
jgi:hypothetical protein